MAYTKQKMSHDKITIDGTDVSNSFRTFGRPSQSTQEEAGGFSVSGVQEFIAGDKEQRFEGEAYYTEELAAIVEPLHDSEEYVEITWQPRGLLDATREVYVGTCQITEFSPSSTFGQIGTFPFVAVPNSGGINVNDWT